MTWLGRRWMPVVCIFPFIVACALSVILELVPARAQDAKTKAANEAKLRSASTTGWHSFRGDAALTGVATSALPAELKVRWRYECPEPVASTAAIANGIAFVGCDDGNLYALNLSNGAVAWKYAAKDAIRSSPTFVRPPKLGKQMVAFGDELGTLHAIDANTGKPIWTYETEAPIVSSANYHQGRFVFGSYDGTLYCVTAHDGKLVWKYQTDDRIHGTPGIAGDVCLTAGCDGQLHVVRLSDGKAIAKVELGSVSGASAAVLDSRVILGTYGNQVLGIDFRARKVAWTYENPDREFPFMSSAAVTHRRAFLGGRDKRLRALDPKTGKLLWEFPTKGRIDSSPVVVGDRVFVGSYDGKIYAVAAATGKEVWHYETGAPFSASPAIGGGCLVIGNEDGVIYCFGSK